MDIHIIRSDLYFDEYPCLPTIPNETIQSVMNNRDIRMAYAMVGDAVYEVLLYLWIRMSGEDVDLNLVNKSKSNVSMSCIMKRSTISYLAENEKKGDGDLFEALIGVVYTHLSDCGNEDITSSLFYWLNKVFFIDEVFSDMIYRGIDPCGVPQDRSTKSLDIPSNLQSSIMKLAAIYSGFNIYCHEKKCRVYIDRHKNYLWGVKMRACSSYLPNILLDIMYAEDPLGSVSDLATNIESVCRRRVGYSPSSHYLEEEEYMDNFEVGDDEDIVLLLQGEDPEYSY